MTSRPSTNESISGAPAFLFSCFSSLTNRSRAGGCAWFNYPFLTSYERDNETSLDYAKARYYSSVQGRFTSVDPLYESAELLMPQSWNRYTYCLNSPLQYTDPTGMVWVKDSSDNRMWIPHDQWDAASQGRDAEGNPLYTILTAEEMEYDSVSGQRVRLDPMGPNPNNPSGWPFIGPNQGSGAGALIGSALLVSQVDSPAPGPADVASVGMGLVALYMLLSHENLLPPTIFNQDNSSDNAGPTTPGPMSDAPTDGNYTDKASKIATALGVSVGAVKDAIHRAKRGLPSGQLRTPTSTLTLILERYIQRYLVEGEAIQLVIFKTF